jgi:excisionase family DNA binding protein
MTFRIILEVNECRHVFSFDELGNSILNAIEALVRQELKRVLASPTTPQTPKESEPNRPVALSKARAAHALGVSVRTLDNCIAQKGIRVVRIGRRVLVPMHSIEAALKRGSLETHGSH